MKIPLNEFEIHVDEDILKRGLQYFKKGYVTAVDELSAGEYEATVEGSESYTVHMEVKNGVMNGCYCNCPYDWGPICKHEVAVMFYLQQEELGIASNPQKTAKRTRAKASSVIISSGSEKKPKKKKHNPQRHLVLIHKEKCRNTKPIFNIILSVMYLKKKRFTVLIRQLPIFTHI